MLKNSEPLRKRQISFFSMAGCFCTKNIHVIHHEELDLLFLVTKGLQELFVQLKVRSVLTHLDICNLMDVPLRKIMEKKISNLEGK